MKYFKQWISQEIDVSVGLAEGRSTLTKLIDERKQLACELASLQERYKDLQTSSNDEEPPKKVIKSLDETYFAHPNDAVPNDEISILKEKIDEIKTDIECKNTQINEIQQMVIEGDLGKLKIKNHSTT